MDRVGNRTQQGVDNPQAYRCRFSGGLPSGEFGNDFQRRLFNASNCGAHRKKNHGQNDAQSVRNSPHDERMLA